MTRRRYLIAAAFPRARRSSTLACETTSIPYTPIRSSQKVPIRSAGEESVHRFGQSDGQPHETAELGPTDRATTATRRPSVGMPWLPILGGIMYHDSEQKQGSGDRRQCSHGRPGFVEAECEREDPQRRCVNVAIQPAR